MSVMQCTRVGNKQVRSVPQQAAGRKPPTPPLCMVSTVMAGSQ